MLSRFRSSAQILWHRSIAQAAHADLTRDPRYAELNGADVAKFQSILGEGGVVDDSTALEAANEDWMGKYKGSSSLLLRPKTTEQVSQVLRHCNTRQLAVVPQGGNSGLVGGGVPIFDEVILSLASMNQIHAMDAVSGALSCQAGCTLQQLDDHARTHGFIMPLDLGAKGSCQAGGFISTNAGGLRFLRYGSLHGTVLGLEAVLADGTILNNMQTLPKDNTGYDLKQLFIGAEGTLGIVTGAAIHCPSQPSAVNVAYLAVPSYDAVTQVYRRARRALGEVLSAFEFLDRQALELTKREMDSIVDPLPHTSEPFNLVVETSGSNAEHDMAKLEAFLEAAMEEGLITDGTIAQDGAQAHSIWSLRENISVALKHAGPVYKYDLSLPSAKLYELVEVMRRRLQHFPVEVVGYGHMGDSNLHLNVSLKEWRPDVAQAIEPFVYEWTSRNGGSVSAEHGLGQMKNNCIGYTKSPEMVNMMSRVKALFDPNHILNPYKLLPSHPSH